MLRPTSEMLGLGFVLVEPAGYVEHFCYVMAGTAADTVRLFRNADEHSVDVEKFQRGVKLFRLGDGRAVVLCDSHNQGRRFDFADVIGQRALHVLLGVVPGIAGKPIFRGERNVAGEHEAVPVDDRIERGGGTETGGVLDSPGGEHAAAAAAGNVEIVGVDVALCDDSVDAAIEVVEVIAGIGMMDEVGELLAITGASARVGVELDGRRIITKMLFEIEAVAVIAKRSAVDFENERIFFGGIEAGRLENPALDLALVL